MKKLVCALMLVNLLNCAPLELGDEEKKERIVEIKKIEIPEYFVKSELKPKKLLDISDEQINDHWKLYEGYVKQVNKLNQDLRELEKKGEASTLIFADRRRRYGFEYNGMVLHEYYFGNLKFGGLKLSDSSKLKAAIEDTWASFDKWAEDFVFTGKTRSIGWAILYCDPQTGRLTNNFISEHQNGNVAGFKPILVMDVWEHAYMVDHNADGRGKYIEAFFKNINWEVAEKRFLEK